MYKRQEKAYTVTFGFYMLDGAAETYRTEADSLKEARNMYDRGHEKNLDFNHLKNFYFSENLMEEEVFGNLLMEKMCIRDRSGTFCRI